MRIVPGDPAVEPEDFFHPEVVGEHALVVLASHPRVAALHVAEQALLGRQEQALAVHFDAPAFEAYVAPRRGAGAGAKQAQLERLRHALGYGVVLLPVRVLGPGVETESGDRNLGMPPFAANEARAEVARPAAVSRPVEEFYARGVNARASEHVPRLLFDIVRRQDSDGLARRDSPHDLGIDPRDGSELARPVSIVVGPAEPGSLVRLPLGRQAIAQRRRAVARALPRLARVWQLLGHRASILLLASPIGLDGFVLV